MSSANRYGRKPGRGFRAWLLIPKVLGVATYFGSLVAAGVLSVMIRPESPGEWRQLGETLSIVFRFAAVPGLITALVFGVLLLLQHPAVFIRMRWVQAKVALLLIGIPLLHLFMSRMVGELRRAGQGQSESQSAMHGFHLGLIAALVIAVTVIWLGRYKPRLGQNLAAMHQKLSARQKGADEEEGPAAET